MIELYILVGRTNQALDKTYLMTTIFVYRGDACPRWARRLQKFDL